MNRTIMGAAILMFGLALGAGLPGEAKAFAGGALVIDGGRGWDGAIQQVSHKKKHHHKKKRHHKRKHHNKHKKHHRSGVFFSFGNVFGAHDYNRRNYYNGGYQAGPRDCHGVVKDGYFHGRYAKIGGTLCYDHRGSGYIVEGTRYLIQYY